jgi:magnesium transporter
MIQFLNSGGDSLKTETLENLRDSKELLTDAYWIDLINPDPEEEQFIEKFLDVNIPSKEEMQEISESSRLFEEEGILYVSCWILCFDSPIPVNTSVTFVITNERFITIRYSDHHAFRIFQSSGNRIQRRRFKNVYQVLAELLETTVGHIASNLRSLEEDLNSLSIEIFAEQRSQRQTSKHLGLKKILQRLGKRNSIIANLRESAVSLSSLGLFLIENPVIQLTPEVSARLKTLDNDIQSLREYAAQLAAEVNFLLDSTVGLISYEQNQTMKFLAVAALLVAFI